jgi:hypothetical protein
MKWMVTESIIRLFALFVVMAGVLLVIVGLTELAEYLARPGASEVSLVAGITVAAITLGMCIGAFIAALKVIWMIVKDFFNG